MATETGSELEAPTQNFMKWLDAGMTGCTFQTSLSRRIWGVAVPSFPPTDDLSQRIEQALSLAEPKAAALVFPQIQTQGEIVTLIQALTRSGRWVNQGGERDGQYWARLWWVDRDGGQHSAVGFAPIFEMPPTRRAPCVGLVVWGGKDSNTLDPARDPQKLGIVAMAPREPTQASYRVSWDNTQNAVGALFTNTPDAGRRVAISRLTFRLPLDVAAPLLPLSSKP